MSTERNAFGSTACVRYDQKGWGEVIEGTKEQLQALGLGVSMAFPGEPGANRREFTVRDPRGYITKISNQFNDAGRYTAIVNFPNVPARPEPQWLPVFPGVSKRENSWADEYQGSAQDLAAAGLLLVNQLPGQPGMRKMRVTVYADGSIQGGRCYIDKQRAREPGARWIERGPGGYYRVTVAVPEDLKKRRRLAESAASILWEQQAKARPQPAKLVPMSKAKWLSLEAARISAARDTRFQGMLARIVSAAGRPPA